MMNETTLLDYDKMIFNAVNESINLYGIFGLEYVLKFNPETFLRNPQEFSKNPLTNILLSIDKSIKENGEKYFICYIQPNQSLLSKLTKESAHDSDFLADKIKEIIIETFKVTDDDIMNKVNRDGLRTYAIGALNKFYFEVLGYDLEKIRKLTNKSYSLISRNKTLISNLNCKISHERDILNKYLLSKHKFINFILKNNER